MKKIGIIGAGISGLYIANLFKKNPKYQVSIFDKKNSLNLDERGTVYNYLQTVSNF